MVKIASLSLALALVALSSCATTAPLVPTIPARPEDVSSIDGLMSAFYLVVNVDPDQPRLWSRDRTLYYDAIRFVGIGKEVTIYDYPAYVVDTEPLIRAGFHEKELHRVVRQYGNIAHVFSTYETAEGMGANVRRSRGVNSLQLYFDGKRWWVASVTWQAEDAAHPLPPELLP